MLTSHEPFKYKKLLISELNFSTFMPKFRIQLPTNEQSRRKQMRLKNFSPIQQHGRLKLKELALFSLIYALSVSIPLPIKFFKIKCVITF